MLLLVIGETIIEPNGAREAVQGLHVFELVMIVTRGEC